MKQLDSKITLDNHDVSTLVKRTAKAALYKRETPEGAPVSYEVFAIRSKNGAEIYPARTAYGQGQLTWAWCPISLEKAEKIFNLVDKSGSPDGYVPLWENIDPETGERIEVSEPEDVVTQETPIPTTEMVETVNEVPEVVVSEPTPEVPEVDIITPTVESTADGGAVVVVAKTKKTQVKTKKVLPTYKFPALSEWLRDDFAEINGMDHHPAHSDSYGPLMQLIKAGKVVEVKKAKVGKGRPRSFYSVVPVVNNVPVADKTPEPVTA